MREESDVYDCATCEVADRIGQLDDDNQMAWGIYRRCCNRFITDLQAGAMLLDRLTQDFEADAFADTCERLRVIYDTLQPPKNEN